MSLFPPWSLLSVQERLKMQLLELPLSPLGDYALVHAAVGSVPSVAT